MPEVKLLFFHGSADSSDCTTTLQSVCMVPVTMLDAHGVGDPQQHVHCRPVSRLSGLPQAESQAGSGGEV